MKTEDLQRPIVCECSYETKSRFIVMAVKGEVINGIFGRSNTKFEKRSLLLLFELVWYSVLQHDKEYNGIFISRVTDTVSLWRASPLLPRANDDLTASVSAQHSAQAHRNYFRFSSATPTIGLHNVLPAFTRRRPGAATGRRAQDRINDDRRGPHGSLQAHGIIIWSATTLPPVIVQWRSRANLWNIAVVGRPFRSPSNDTLCHETMHSSHRTRS